MPEKVTPCAAICDAVSANARTNDELAAITVFIAFSDPTAEGAVWAHFRTTSGLTARAR